MDKDAIYIAEEDMEVIAREGYSYEVRTQFLDMAEFAKPGIASGCFGCGG